MSKEKWLDDNGNEIEITEEYFIISKTAIQKRIEELENLRNHSSSDNNDYYQGQIKSLKYILSQSTPLIPEIEKAFEQGQNSVEAIMKCEEFGDMDWYAAKKITQSKQEYIANLKLNK